MYPGYYPTAVPPSVVPSYVIAGPAAAAAATPSQSAVYSTFPVPVVCAYCNSAVTTQVEHVSGLMTFLAAGGLVFVGCWLGCCLIPFAISDLKDVVHTCPNCHSVIGRYNRLH
jgi:lipopolysaccharide-induced tumor necrosis factor-alpha factor